MGFLPQCTPNKVKPLCLFCNGKTSEGVADKMPWARVECNNDEKTDDIVIFVKIKTFLEKI